MEKDCQCSEADVRTCTQCTEFYCSNCITLKLKEDYEDIFINKNYCLQCSYGKIRKLAFVHTISPCTSKKFSSDTMHRTKKLERRHSWHGPIQNLRNIEDNYVLKKDFSEEERVLIHNLFLKKSDEFLLFFTVTFENILTFKNKLNKTFLSNDIPDAYSYLIKFIYASLNTLNLWHEQIKEVDDIFKQKLDSDFNKTPRKNKKYKLSLRKSVDNEINITENVNGTKLAHDVTTDEQTIKTNVNFIEENSNDSIFSYKTEAVIEDCVDCDTIIESTDKAKELVADCFKNGIDNTYAKDNSSSESEKSFVFDINRSSSTLKKHEDEIQFGMLNVVNECTSSDERIYEMCTQENNFNEPLLGTENIIEQKIDFLKSLGLEYKNVDVSKSQVEIVENESNMDRLLCFIEDEPFITSEEESGIDDLEDQDSNEYIELPEEYENYNLKPCSVVLEKIDETSLVCVDDKLKSVFDEHHKIASLNEEEEIERLINLTNLDKKRKHTFSKTTSKKKVKTNCNELNSNRTDLELDSDASDEDMNPLNLIEHVCDSVQKDTFNADVLENVLNRICNDEDNNCQEESDGFSDIDHLTKNKKIRTDIDKKLGNKENEPEKSTLSDQELPADNLKNDNKSDWRKDPLLVCSLQEKTEKNKTKFSSSDVKSENIIPDDLRDRILKLEARMLNKTNTTVRDPLNEDTQKEEAADVKPTSIIQLNDVSDEEDVEAKYNKIIVNSDSDSDIEFVSVVKNVKRKSGNNSVLDDKSDDENNSETRRGRKNIRPILEYDTLTEATKEANLLERKRKNRLTQKHKHMDAILSSSQFSEDDDGLILDLDETTKSPIIVVHPTISTRLKPHQKAGVKFMWESCYEGVKQVKNGYPGSGCILAHCMGLGKTLQVITLIHTLFSHSVTNTKHVLVICPLSVVLHWKKEFDQALKNIKDKLFNVFYICDKKIKPFEKSSTLEKWKVDKGVLILGYECYHRWITPKDPDNVTLQEYNILETLSDPGPDLIVLDEGHLIKNEHSVRSKSLRSLKTKRRIVLTGTPLQNNLIEYYFMIQFVKPNLLGSLQEFKNRFANPITNGQYHDSTEVDIIKMKKRSHILNKLLKGTVQRFELSELVPYLKKRHDYALFIQLHPIQMDLYEKETKLARSNTPETTHRQIITNYHKFRFIWSHPYMFHLKEMAAAALRAGNEGNSALDVDYWWKGFCPPDSDININYGPKFKVMFSIIKECEKVGDKILVFSNSLLELDAIEHFLQQYSNSDSQWICNEDYIRMDGRTATEKRVQLCDSFNDKDNVRKRLFLISNKVGGMGLNLIGANRVILMDVNWNPAYDSQSVFRIYRFGQEKECFIYRLVSMGTMEEVVYDRQVTKLAISGRVVDSLQITRHFKSNDLQMFYSPKFNRDQIRPTPPLPADCLLAKVLQSCNEIFRYHEHQSLLENLPEENLNEDEMKIAWDEFNKENERENELQMKKKANFAAAVAAAAAAACQSSTDNQSNAATNSVSQVKLPSLPPESEFPVASTSGTTTLANQSAKNVRIDQRAFEPGKLNNNVANKKAVKSTKILKDLTFSSKKKNIENNSKVASKETNDQLNNARVIANAITKGSRSVGTSKKSSVNHDQNPKGPIVTSFKKKKSTKRINPVLRQRLSKSNDNIPVINLDLIADTKSIEASTSNTTVLEQPISNSKVALSSIRDTIINLDSDDNLLMKEQQLLISSLNQNLDITLSALQRSTASGGNKSDRSGDVIEID